MARLPVCCAGRTASIYLFFYLFYFDCAFPVGIKTENRRGLRDKRSRSVNNYRYGAITPFSPPDA